MLELIRSFTLAFRAVAELSSYRGIPFVDLIEVIEQFQGVPADRPLVRGSYVLLFAFN